METSSRVVVPVDNYRNRTAFHNMVGRQVGWKRDADVTIFHHSGAFPVTSGMMLAEQTRESGDDMGKDVLEAFEGQHERFGYSQAVAVGDSIYVAGTLGMSEAFTIPDDLAEQMALAYRNIADTLGHFGADMSHVVDQKVFVTDIDAAMAAMDVRRAAYPAGAPPASTMVEVSRLGLPQAKVEISVVARRDA